MNGSALAVNWASGHVAAILEAWYPGESGGTAVAQALAGDFSPAGRLPVTFYKSVQQLPPFENYSMANRTYRYFNGEPLYRFGYGLSYTTFRYSDPQTSLPSISADGTVKLSALVTNTGAMGSDEVVQLYLTHQGIPGAPLRELHGFQRIHLLRGQSRRVTFSLRDRDLSVVDADGQRRIRSGLIQAWIGNGQPATHATSTMPASVGVTMHFNITSEELLPE
jgi:beta-glucosidase